MLDPGGPRSWLTWPETSTVAARILWVYVWAEFGWFRTAKEEDEFLKRAQAWTHWLRVHRATPL